MDTKNNFGVWSFTTLPSNYEFAGRIWAINLGNNYFLAEVVRFELTERITVL